jgi:hypothetical protein
MIDPRGEYSMSVIEKLTKDLQNLPDSAQAEVLDFVEFLTTKAQNAEHAEWAAFSLTQAARGMEKEPDLYSECDLKEVFE